MKKLYLFIMINFMTTLAFADVSELNCTELGCGTAFPECEANTFSIEYSGGADGVTGDAPAAPTSCSYDSECLAPANTYARSGFKFAGWDCQKSDGKPCNQNGGKYQPGDNISKATTTDDDTITLSASWVIEGNYIISYDGKGGNIDADAVNGKGTCNAATETFDLPTEITRDNSRFLGWKLNGEGDYVTTVNQGDCTENKTFVADWACDTGYKSSADGTACVVIEYDIVYALNGGENNLANKSTYKITDSDIVLAAPTRANSKFEGWYTEAEFTNATDKILSGSTDTKVVYAKWSCNDGYAPNADNTACLGNMITIAYAEDGGAEVSDATCTFGENFIIADATSRTGYTFRGWKLADGTVVPAATQIACNDTTLGVFSGTTDKVVAQWSANNYLVTYSCSDATIAPAPEENYAMYDSEYTVADNTCVNNGYTFTGWAVSDTERVVKPGDKFTWNYTTNKTLTAQWTINSYECAAGEYLASGATECSVCEAGSYCVGGTYEYSAVQTQGMSTCSANSYSDAGAGICTDCATGYTNSDDHAGIASCKITCLAGEYVAEAGKGCVSVETGYYGLGGTVGQDDTLARTQCPEDYREGSAATQESDCMGSCDVACSGNEVCPENSIDCTHDSSEVSSGTHTYGNQICNAVVVKCPVSGFGCAAGYNKTSEGCSAGDRNAITYNTDGGNINGEKTDSCNVESSTIALPTDVTKTGYTFDGWYKDGVKVTQIAAGTCTGAISLVARWTACTPCNAGAGASCELSVVNNQCVYTTKCADNYYNEQGAGTPTPSCETCVKSCSGNTNGFVLGEYNVCRNETSGQCYRNCVVGDVSNAYAVSGTITANGNNGCMATSCVSNSYLSGGNCTSCDSGYTAPNNNTGDQSSCTKSCQVACSGTATCPSNAICEYNTAYMSSGTQAQGGKCSATAVVCPITSFQCESGYTKTLDGKSCVRADYKITYNMGGGQNYAGAPTSYVAGIGTTIDGTPTYAGYVFEGWCLDAGKTNCDDRVVISENAAKDVSVWAKWSLCTNGYYCNGVQNQCPDTHPYSNSGSDTVSDCYAKCEPMTSEDYMTIYPAQDTVNYPASCDYNTEVTCRPGYQLVNGNCTACPYDKNAVTYGDGCKIDSCAFGYHPNGSVCDSDIIDCVAPNGLHAQREWDREKKAYGICKIVECADDYRLVDNVCLPNTEVCTLANGVGIREWDFNKNKWGACIATSCNPGYTNDRSMTNEIWLQCGRCNNAYGKDGELAVSSYVRECEIATCMYQGELYTLENNECRLICDEYSDETGRRYWDSSRKKCIHECAPGFIKW